jgi:hypothetical protein
MRRNERKSTGARGVSNYLQETNVTQYPDIQPPLGATEIDGMVVVKTITSEELRDYLKHLHWIPAFRGVPSGIHSRFMEYKPLEFLGHFQRVGAVTKESHFPCRAPSKNLLYVTLYIGGHPGSAVSREEQQNPLEAMYAPMTTCV